MVTLMIITKLSCNTKAAYMNVLPTKYTQVLSISDSHYNNSYRLIYNQNTI